MATNEVTKTPALEVTARSAGIPVLAQCSVCKGRTAFHSAANSASAAEREINEQFAKHVVKVHRGRGLFLGRRSQLSREEAIEQYILLRLRVEDIKRLAFLVESLYGKSIQIPQDAPFTAADLKDASRTAFLGWFASLMDRDNRAVYAFDPLLVLFPARRARIINVQVACEACREPLQRFRNKVAFHNEAELAAQIDARKALRNDDTVLYLESARIDFLRLMDELASEELSAIPQLSRELERLGLSGHPAFFNRR